MCLEQMKNREKIRVLFFILILMMCSSVCVAQTKSHTVTRGETLQSIAQKYEVSEDAIRQVNPNMGSMFYVGMKLDIPDTKGQATTLVLQEDTMSSESVVEKNKIGGKEDAKNKQEKELKAEWANKQSINAKVKERVGIFNLFYYNFDGLDNYGFIDFFPNLNGIGWEFSVRGNFKQYSNVNADFALNYTFDLWEKDEMSLYLVFAVGPSLRYQDIPEYKYDERTGKTEKDSKMKFFVDGILNPRVSFKIKRVFISAGFFYWAPKFKFSKDDGATSGFNVGIGYLL